MRWTNFLGKDRCRYVCTILAGDPSPQECTGRRAQTSYGCMATLVANRLAHVCQHLAADALKASFEFFSGYKRLTNPSLATSIAGAKQGGQDLLQCMDVHVSRNFFGAQIASFEQALPVHECITALGGPSTFRAVFIRAPAILSAGPDVVVLAEYVLSPEKQAIHGRDSVIIAARSANMLATAFHPELTDDIRWYVPCN